jgi:FixJ family two-component response regulator
MPKMAGLQLAEKLYSDGSFIPMLLMTGSPALAAQLEIRVMEKPSDEEGVLDFINATRSRSLRH